MIIIMRNCPHAHWFAYTCTCSFAVRFQKELQQWRVAPGVLSYVFCAVLGSPEGATARLDQVPGTFHLGTSYPLVN